MPTKPDALKSGDHLREAPGPQGLRQTLNLSPSFLLGVPYDDRETVAKAAGPNGAKCGLMYGVITHGFRHPNYKDPTKTSVRWVGAIGFQTADGANGRASNAYLPATVERTLYNAGVPIVVEGSGHPPPFRAEFSVEFWIEPVPKARSAAGYIYACYDRAETHAIAINHLAPPEIRAMLPLEEERPLLGYDPDTGEIDAIDQEAAQ